MSEESGIRSYIPLAGMLLLLLVVQICALAVTPLMIGAGYEAFEDPDSAANPIFFIVLLLIFTAVLLWLIRKGKKNVITAIIGFSIVFIFLYIYSAVFLFLLGPTIAGYLATGVATVLSTAVLYLYPEWYVIDVMGVIVSAGAASIFGISLGILPVILLLVLLAVYDAISVYRTKHMIDLAEGVIATKSPILVVVPKSVGYSYRKEGIAIHKEKNERGAFIMGMGDLIMPSILVVSSYAFLEAPSVFWTLSLPTIGAIAGSLAGLVVLMHYVNKGNVQAGLPLLNGGVITGFLLGCMLAGTWGWLPYI
ncbi:hypothetical protein AZH53_03670 [Methanomicrobiaceae archaeon CYW5]|uniref:presenilin family intramembrane aspartyl protease PSH n=1 Tax=Methanovulcanius yangii TaxID=1789227 RepID=UPI0029CA61C1|nr:presenilin family intramembrane aspartyl protease PSH [Methanovulcanius yangii]MBT8507520.1 hypothetical protein [Methanovulcanius yangii]